MKRLSLFILAFMIISASHLHGVYLALEAKGSIPPYSDVRNKDLRGIDLDKALIRTLWFNEKTIWDPEDKQTAMQVMEEGKNPGLGVRYLHGIGITGKGVNVAIIDQNICLDHPEFAGKIIKYRDMGCNQPANEGSMHGPAVTSLLVGNTIGTAPEAKVYYAAVPTWTKDAKYYAEALDWIISENRLLPENQKIRVVSVSAAPSASSFKNGQMWDQAFFRAQDENILVLDCTESHGLVGPCYYDPDFPEDVNRCHPGFPGEGGWKGGNFICAPASLRTEAEEYVEGDFSYQYTGRGGLSWAIPYVAGILALGWQLKPELSIDPIWRMLRNSAYIKSSDLFINPVAFINQVVEWQVYPPIGFTLERLENNFIFFKEYINRLSWEPNPENKSAIVSFKLFRKERGTSQNSYQPLIELWGNIFDYDDRGLKKDQFFTYKIVSVAANGMESNPAIVGN